MRLNESSDLCNSCTSVIGSFEVCEGIPSICCDVFRKNFHVLAGRKEDVGETGIEEVGDVELGTKGVDMDGMARVC